MSKHALISKSLNLFKLCFFVKITLFLLVIICIVQLTLCGTESHVKVLQPAWRTGFLQLEGRARFGPAWCEGFEQPEELCVGVGEVEVEKGEGEVGGVGLE